MELLNRLKDSSNSLKTSSKRFVYRTLSSGSKLLHRTGERVYDMAQRVK